MELLRQIVSIIDEHRHIKPLVVAIDGRCGSGKTTLATGLKQHYSCTVIPMDHFFLRPEQRTDERLSVAGENIDHERFIDEVLRPLQRCEPICYRPYNCATQRFAEPVVVTPSDIIIIEGSYSCNSALWEYYGLRLFVTTSSEEQLKRIIQRDGEDKLHMYKSRWIPLEEQYFSAFDIEARCDYKFTT